MFNAFGLHAALALAAFSLLGAHCAAGDANPFVYVAGYDNAVDCFEFNSQSGEMKLLSTSDCGALPTYIAWNPARTFMYAANETNPAGKVTAFSIDPKDGKLTKLNEASSGGGGPAHIVVHPDGKWICTANYGSGHVGVLPIKADGSVGEPVLAFHDGSHAHEVIFDATGKFAFVPFLGSGKVGQYKFDEASGQFSPNDPPALASAQNAGPRHIVFHPSARFAYVLNELNCTMDSVLYDKDRGLLSAPETLSTLPEGAKKGAGAHVVPSPDGKFVYGSTRGVDTIVIYAVDAQSGRLKVVGFENGGGEIKTPRDFTIDPSGNFMLVANQGSGSVTVFKRNETSGTLEKIGNYKVHKQPSFVGVMPRP